MWCWEPIFRLEEVKEVHQASYKIWLAISGVFASLLGVAAAGRGQLPGCFVLAGLGSLCVQFACLWWIKERTLSIFIFVVLMAALAVAMVHYQVLLPPNYIATGSEEITWV